MMTYWEEMTQAARQYWHQRSRIVEVSTDQLAEVLEGFFHDQYRLDDIQEFLNKGVPIPEDEVRTLGRTVQARCNVAQVLERLARVQGQAATGPRGVGATGPSTSGIPYVSPVAREVASRRRPPRKNLLKGPQ